MELCGGSNAISYPLALTTSSLAHPRGKCRAEIKRQASHDGQAVGLVRISYASPPEAPRNGEAADIGELYVGVGVIATAGRTESEK